MGTEYEADLVVGFVYSIDEIDTLFRRETEPRTEPRYDRRTGVRLPDVVVQSSIDMYALPNDDDVCDLIDLLEKIDGLVGSAYSTEYDEWAGRTGRVAFGVPVPGGSQTVTEIANLRPKLDVIGQRLADLGLPEREPEVEAFLSAY